MNALRTTLLSLAIAAVVALPGCNRGADQDAAAPAAADGTASADTDAEGSGGIIASAIDKGLAEARRELHEENLVVGGDRSVDVSVGGWEIKSDRAAASQPRAEISPKGDFLVDGKAVAVTPEQRKRLLQYRSEVLAVADAGLAIGSKGADLAGKAIGEAIGSIFGGDTKAMEQRVEAEAEKLKQEAKVICTRLPAMLSAQQALAASLPAFAPYATMTQADVDDCMDEIEDKGTRSTP